MNYLLSILLSFCLSTDPNTFMLYYGNSFTLYSGVDTPTNLNNIPDVVEQIAADNGNIRPHGRIFDGSGGWDLRTNYLQNNGVNVWGFSPYPSDHWDYLILQELSTGPTHIGNIPSFYQYAGLLEARIRPANPDVSTVLYQTWSRAYPHDLYSGLTPAFPGGPNQMNSELESNYYHCSTLLGAKYAPVGTAWKILDWDRSLYNSDLYHQSPKGLLLAGCVIYCTIYNENIADKNLAFYANRFNLTANDLLQIRSACDRACFHLNNPKDFNRDGEITPDDLADFIGEYFSSNPSWLIDFNKDNEITPDDLADFLGVYFS